MRDGIDDIISFAYPNLTKLDTTFFSTRVILFSTNATIDYINTTILGTLPGERMELLMSETAAPSSVDHTDCVQHAIAPPEYAIAINVAGVPTHRLSVKNEH